MTGLYGDEVLRHLRAFKPTKPIPGLYSPSVVDQVDTARETYAEVLKGDPTSFAVFRQAPWHHYGILALEKTQLSVRTPYLDNDFVRTVFRAPTRLL
jgi:asparagine synthase (glutamine-hydrolysing)